MKIINQTLQLSSQHSARIESQTNRVHETFINGQTAHRTSTQSTQQTTLLSHDSLSIHSQNARSKTLSPIQTQNNQNQLKSTPINQIAPIRHNELNNNQPPPMFDNSLLKPNTQTEKVQTHTNLPAKLIRMIEAIEGIMERLTGKPHTLKVVGYADSNSINQSNENSNFLNPAAMKTQSNQLESISTQGQQWSLTKTYSEFEQTLFSAQGQVTTSDGKKISFELNANMQREYITQLNIEKQQGVILKDPLVVNFGGSPAQLTIDKIDFDLDNDGTKEMISFVTPSSGFLALDKNQDGTINNGSELFGAMTGDGFSELSQYDQDSNGWIDENDAIFSQLQVWQKDANGFNQLSGLLQLGIGAISLSHINTPFALKDENNQQHGQILTSGLYLKESGEAGSIQQIDLVI